MPLHSTEAKVFGFKAEASRGTAETTPDKFLAVGPDASLDYSHTPIEDNKVRGTKLRFESIPGVKGVSGSLPDVDVEATTIGPLLKGVLGTVVTTTPDGGQPTVKQHVVTRSNSPELPYYTCFMDRGLGKKRYNLGTWKKLTFSGPTDGPVRVSADVLAQKAGRDASGHFNVLHLETDAAADVYLAGKDSLARRGLDGRRFIRLVGRDVPIAPPEYVILHKLRFRQQGASERHLRDVRAMLRVLGDTIDRAALARDVIAFGLTSAWDELQRVGEDG